MNRLLESTIRYGVLGSAPNRHFVVSWVEVPRYGSASTSYSFQVVLYGDDAVEVYIDDTLITSWYRGHATRIRYVNASSGYHKIEYHMQEREGDDSYYLYWQRPLESSITIVPALRFFHCIASLAKTSCVISDPVNGTGNGVSPVKLDFHTVSAGTIKCGYFEVGLSR